MSEDNGRVPLEPGSRASTEPVPVSAASGFDPSRVPFSVREAVRIAISDPGSVVGARYQSNDGAIECLQHWQARAAISAFVSKRARGLVIIESPYAGDVEKNVAYARAAMRDSLSRGEYPIASHLLYTQPDILRDEVPEERELGIAAGLAWRKVANKAVFYIDRGWSAGMLAAEEIYRIGGLPFEIRSLRDSDEHPQGENTQPLSGEAMPARAESIAQDISPEPLTERWD